MMKTPGRCPNTATCALAKRRRTVLVELKHPFVCPSCGSALVPPPVSAMPDVKLLAAGGGGALLVAAGLALWLTSGKPPPPPPHASVVRAPVQPSPATPPPAPPISPNGSSGPAGPTTVTIPPQLLAAAGVTSTNGQTPAAAGATTVTPLAPPPTEVVPPAAVPAPPKHREHHVVAAARSTGPKAPPVSMQALNASHPEYPDAYEDTDQKGEVTVTCLIKPDGAATGCKIIHQSGGAAFGKSVLDWLALTSTRFPPLLKHGRPATLPFTWNVDFDP